MAEIEGKIDLQSDTVAFVKSEIARLSQDVPTAPADEFMEKVAEIEGKIDLQSDTVAFMESSLGRLKAMVTEQVSGEIEDISRRLALLEEKAGPMLEKSVQMEERFEVLETRIETGTENMQRELELLAEEIHSEQADLEKANERINSALEKLQKKMEINRDKVKILVEEKLRTIEEKLLSLRESATGDAVSAMEDRINKLEKESGSSLQLDALKDQLEKISRESAPAKAVAILNGRLEKLEKGLGGNILEKLEPMEETMKELTGTLDSKLDPLRQEIAQSKGYIEKELMKVKETWEKLDKSISDSEGAMEIALRAREALERIEKEVADAISRAEGLIASIGENSLRSESNLEKINLTIKLIDEARERVKAVQNVSPGPGLISPSLSPTEDLVFTPREILEDPDTSEIGFELDDLLRVMMKHEASDLHIKAGAPPTVRLEGELVPVGNQILSEEDCKKLVLSAMTPGLRQQLARRREVDLAYSIPEARFRVNAFLQKQSVSAAFRLLLTDIPNFEQLHMPDVMKKLCDYNNGLIIITGPAGSGKSTTLASMVNHINETRKLHVVTIEDPIEFIHQDKLSIITQREVGTDTNSFQNALKQSLRQDPNVIMIGEMRDPDTIMTAVLAAETGHMVLSSLHTPNTIQAINRIIDVFTGDIQKQFRLLLANNLRGVVSQRLLSRADGTGRIPAVEVMVVTPTIAGLILDERAGEIYDLMTQGGIEGMQTFTQSLMSLVDRGLVTREEALFHADQPTEFRLALEGHTSGGSSMQDDSLMSWL